MTRPALIHCARVYLAQSRHFTARARRDAGADKCSEYIPTPEDPASTFRRAA